MNSTATSANTGACSVWNSERSASLSPSHSYEGTHRRTKTHLRVHILRVWRLTGPSVVRFHGQETGDAYNCFWFAYIASQMYTEVEHVQTVL